MPKLKSDVDIPSVQLKISSFCDRNTLPRPRARRATLGLQQRCTSCECSVTSCLDRYQISNTGTLPVAPYRALHSLRVTAD